MDAMELSNEEQLRRYLEYFKIFTDSDRILILR